MRGWGVVVGSLLPRCAGSGCIGENGSRRVILRGFARGDEQELGGLFSGERE